MKICLVNSYYPPWIGGAETYLSNVAKGLKERGHQVTVYCSERPLRAGERFENGIRVVRMRTPFRVYSTPITVIPTSLLTERYDVIHANFPGPYLAAVSALIAKATGTPIVLTWHNDLPPFASVAGIIVKLHDRFSSSYLDLYTRIVSTTNVYARNSKTLRRYSEKVRVIHNGVDTTRFNPSVDGDYVKEKHGLGRSKVALFVGALTTWHAYKGVDVLLGAFSKVCRTRKDVRLVIVGGGNLTNQYKALANEFGISSNVVFAGEIDAQELSRYYAACDIAVLPSKDSSEGFGLVLMEAMATGKAVIGSRVGGVPEVITDGFNGILVEPNNVEALARAMEFLFQNDEARVLMGRHGRMLAEQNDWSTVAKKLESLYRKIL
ncbi:MAG: glycosyltransferase family 4 protein [Nitrososphaerota archaeon]|nr:glycosyltransferase family 4 protein [Nitrososphaerota archaeon]